MKNIYNKTIILSLGILAILAFGVALTPVNADANYFPSRFPIETEYGGTTGNFYQPNTNYYQSRYYYVEPTPVYYPVVQTPTYVNPAPVYANPEPTATPVVYSSTDNPNKVAVATTKTVAKKTSTTNNTVAKTDTSANKENADLAAGVIFGSNSLIPSGLIQWILFAILVLIAAILIRKIYGGDKRYHSTPLKHD